MDSEEIAVYSEFANGLEQHGLTVEMFPYDWRKSTHETAALFDAWIKDDRHGERRPWILVGHGLGGLVLARWAISDLSPKPPVSALVLVGTPLHGAAKALGWAVQAERDYSKLLKPVLGSLEPLAAPQYHELYRSLLKMDSFRELLPLVDSQCARLSGNKVASLSGLPELLSPAVRKAWTRSNLSEWIVSRAAERTEIVGRLRRTCEASGMKLACVASDMEDDTPGEVLIDESGCRCITPLPGDGVVTVQSALAAARPDQQIIVEATHSELVCCEDFLSFLGNLAKGIHD